MSEAPASGPQLLRVNASAQRRLESGHQWVFSNEVLDKLPAYEPGQIVTVGNNKGRPLAVGYVNPHTLIAVRVLAPHDETVDAAFFRARIEAADAWRKQLYPGLEVYRVIHGDADGLAGLVVDRYGDHLAVQVLTKGMEAMRALWQPVLEDIFKPKAIIARNDSSFRTYEDLPQEVTILAGEPDERIVVDEFGVKYELDVRQGQKTGLFLDQKDNRRAIQPFAKDATVLDAFCYVGGWSLAAAKAGARSVVGIDSSEPALVQARRNAELNGVADRCVFDRGDVFDELRNMGAEGHEFDIVVIDPPAFAKRRADVKQATRGYRDVNIQALKLVREGGILVTCTCSHHMAPEQFRNVVVQAGRATGRTLRLVEARGAAADHPVLLSMRETEYLTCLIMQVI